MLLLVLTALLGCSTECPSDTRLNGDYAVWSYVTAPTADITGQDIADYPWPAMFFNGWSAWNMEYVSGHQQVQIFIDDQPFPADFHRAPDDCRNFTMQFAGTYLSDQGSTHDFQWQGDLAYQGPNMTGTWVYQDTWSNTADGTSGSVNVPEGQISLTAGGAVGDTGL